jgi:hypothetical protein
LHSRSVIPSPSSIFGPTWPAGSTLTMKILEVPPNTRVFLGSPTEPISASLVERIAEAIYDIDGVEQLHLPQCFVIGVLNAPQTVLVMVVGANHSVKRAGKLAKKALLRLLPPGTPIGLWPIAFDSPYVASVHHVNCRVERDPVRLPSFRKPKPWWSFLLAN